MIKRFRIAAAMAAVLVAGALGVAAPTAAQAADINPCQLDQKVNELAAAHAGQNVNIMVYNTGHDEGHQFDGIIEEGGAIAQPCNESLANLMEYHWVVFTGGGHFDRKYDGGYMNWAWAGIWDRPADDLMNFHPW